MRLGVNVPNYGPGTDPATLRAWARVAEGLGYDLLMVSDHVAVTPDVAQRYPAPFYEPFTTLAYLAGTTSRIRIGTTVLIAPYRHPLLTASMAATLDRLSGGRLVLGVGVGWAREEFEALGLPFARRGAMTDDYLAAVRDLWTNGLADHAGPFVRFAGVATGAAGTTGPAQPAQPAQPARSVQPAQPAQPVLPAQPAHGHPPLWIGGNSDAALRRAVRLGQAWHPLRFTMPWLREALARLRGIAAGAGAPVPALAPRIALRVTPDPVPDTGERLVGHGTLAQIAADLDNLRALGATTVVLDPYHGDPAETRRPQVPWRDLAAVAAAYPDALAR